MSTDHDDKSDDMANWTEDDLRDVMTYGRCWCGRPRASVLRSDTNGVVYVFDVRCRVGHPMTTP